jgi:serine phosphatase RsbU (regulator of sigma subunit)
MSTTRKTLLVIWIAALGVAVGSDYLDGLFARGAVTPFDFVTFWSRVIFITLTIFFIAVGFRWMLRALFWRVGRRLALSYFLIGVLPFLFFAVLIVVVGYLLAGLLSETALKMERSATLARLTEWNLKYQISGARPGDAPATLEIYDSKKKSEPPEWLRETSFSGLVSRNKQVLFVVSKLYEIEGEVRSVTFVQPVDANWSRSLESRNGMMTAAAIGEVKEGTGSDADINLSADDEVFDPFLKRAFRRQAVIWFDISPTLREWSDGSAVSRFRMVTLVSNPWSNLRDMYFDNSKPVQVSVAIIVGIAGSLAVVYLLAALLAGGLIFSITRAVNRIDKGTKAVERGDFSYRIAMKPNNQLGEVAQSFNRMTASISSLLSKVAEKERLQSEIDIAASIQRNLLPKEGPSFRGVSFAAHFEPTAQIGGDYYDVFNLDRSRLAVAIGDVSGHGLSTGLVMAMVKAAITTLVEEGTDERSIFVRLNDLVTRSTDKRSFMTLGFTIFDLERRIIRHTNAGHLYPYLLRQGAELIAIEAPSLPLGMKPHIEPHTIEVPLQEGDTLVYLSDGIIETLDEGGDPLGFDKLEAILPALIGESPATIQEAILEAVASHTGGRVSEDDRTIMILRFDNIAAMTKPIERPLAEART